MKTKKADDESAFFVFIRIESYIFTSILKIKGIKCLQFVFPILLVGFEPSFIKAQSFTTIQVNKAIRFSNQPQSGVGIHTSNKSKVKSCSGITFGFGYEKRNKSLFLGFQLISLKTEEDLLKYKLNSDLFVVPYAVTNKINRLVLEYSFLPFKIMPNFNLIAGAVIPLGHFRRFINKGTPISNDSGYNEIEFIITQFPALRFGLNYSRQIKKSNFKFFVRPYLDYHLPELIRYPNLLTGIDYFEGNNREQNLVYFNAAIGLRYYLSTKK